jgi:hypothetical protein
MFAFAACGASQHVHRPTTGTIAGLARDHDTGDPIAKAEIRVRAEGEMKARLVVTGMDGTYRLDHLPPGAYSVDALFAGQPIDIEHIGVRAGEIAVADVTFTLGRPDPVHLDFNDAKASAIDRYRPPHLADSRAIIEGTINETGTREPVVGAVVYAIDEAGTALSTVSDDQGRYRIDTVPGTYAVSAYYSIGGRGQIEVRRMDIHVAGAEAVVVPLWVEIARQ